MRTIATIIALAVVTFLASPATAESDKLFEHQGSFVVEFMSANGFDAAPLTAEQYARFVASGACQPKSKLGGWRGNGVVVVQFLCEL